MNQKKVKYSIVVPCYNIAEYLPQFLENIPTINNDFELIFINDGSTDDTLDILKKFIMKNSDFILINLKTNAGVANAVNTGVNNMKTHWYGRLDPDDIVYKNYFCEITKHINDKNVLIRYKFQIYNDGKISNPNLLRKLYFRRAWGWSLLINTKFMKKPHLTQNKFYEDLYAFAKNYKLTNKREIFINKYLAAYRINRSGSITDTNFITERKIEDLRRAYILYKNNKDIKLSIIKILLMIKIWFDIRHMNKTYNKQQKLSSLNK